MAMKLFSQQQLTGEDENETDVQKRNIRRIN